MQGRNQGLQYGNIKFKGPSSLILLLHYLYQRIVEIISQQVLLCHVHHNLQMRVLSTVKLQLPLLSTVDNVIISPFTIFRTAQLQMPLLCRIVDTSTASATASPIRRFVIRIAQLQVHFAVFSRQHKQWRHQNFLLGAPRGKMQFWGGKNPKICRKWLILAIFSSDWGKWGEGRASDLWANAPMPPPLDASTEHNCKCLCYLPWIT